MGFELIMHLPFAVKSEVKSKAIYLNAFVGFKTLQLCFKENFSGNCDQFSGSFAQQYTVPSPKHEGFRQQLIIWNTPPTQ